MIIELYELDSYFDLHRGFNEIGMTYSRYENVIIDFTNLFFDSNTLFLYIL